MFDVLRFVFWRMTLSLADRAVTNPLLSWTWSGSSDTIFVPRLRDFRSSDTQSVVEMMNGQYLLAGRLITTDGVSPFGIEPDAKDWAADLHSFGWLRHFRDLRDTGQRRFARTLVLDWIGRYSDFDRRNWELFITARRVLNWLKAYGVLTEDAGPDQVRSIARSLNSQIESIKVRMGLAQEPQAALMAAIALVGASLCSADDDSDLDGHLARLLRLLENQIDKDGLHLSRNPFLQLQLLTELIPVNQLLGQRHGERGAPVARIVETMHRAFDRLVLGTGEPGYFNGSGQVPVELVYAIGAQSGARSSGSGLSGGYGILIDGQGKLIADGGRVPPVQYSGSAHAGGMSFEFSYGGMLVVGNCGPAPSQLPDSRNLFRQTSAHSAPTLNDISSARIGGRGFLWDRLRPLGTPGSLTLSHEENALEMRCGAYRDRYGIDLVRRLTLMGGGHTLVGQDSFEAAGRRGVQNAEFIIRFHMASDVTLERSEIEDMIVMHLRNGQSWAFLWEGALAEIEDSVRHSNHFGLVKTRQIVLSGAVRADHEIAWVFTRQ